MSTDLKSHAKDVSLTRFWGGDNRGSSVQVTQPNPNYDTDTGGHRFNYVQLTREQAVALALDLLDFAAGREKEEV